MLQQNNERSLSRSKPVISPKPRFLRNESTYSSISIPRNNENRRQQYVNKNEYNNELLTIQGLYNALYTNHEMTKRKLEENSEKLRQLSEVSTKLYYKYKSLKNSYEKLITNESHTKNKRIDELKSQPKIMKTTNETDSSLFMAIINEIHSRQEQRNALSEISANKEEQENSRDIQIEDIKHLLEEEIPTTHFVGEESILDNKTASDDSELDLEIENQFIVLKALQERLESRRKEVLSTSTFYVDLFESERQNSSKNKTCLRPNIPRPSTPMPRKKELSAVTNIQQLNQEIKLKVEPRRPVVLLPEIKLLDKDEVMSPNRDKANDVPNRSYMKWKHKNQPLISWDEMKKILAFFYWYYFLDDDEFTYG